MKKQIVSVSMLALLLGAAAWAQTDKSKRPSPPASASCDLGSGKTVTSDYSSPRVKGRKIFGALVPYGEVWRTGANEATTFVASADVNVGGTAVPAGNYTIFTLPTADKWTLIINKHTGEWGVPYKYESEELARVPMTVAKTSGPVENFTLAYDKTGSGCTMRVEWENTSATVNISAK